MRPFAVSRQAVSREWDFKDFATCRRTKFALTFLLTLWLWLVFAPANAVLLPPGSSVGLSGTSAAARPELAGTSLEDILIPLEFDFGGGKVFRGQLQNSVRRSTLDNTLIFSYRLISEPSSTIAIQNLSTFFVADPATITDVDYRTDGLGEVAPGRATRDADGRRLLFVFSQQALLPGQSSRFLFVKTTATEYAHDDTTFLEGHRDSSLYGLGPFVTFRPVYHQRLFGTITLEGCENSVQPVTFTFIPVHGEATFQRTTVLDQSGGYELLIPWGEYEVVIKGEKTVSARKHIPVVGVPPPPPPSRIDALLRAGDANGDNSIDALDLADLITAFNSTPGDQNYNQNADFNCDDSVDALDLALLITNFNTEGEP